MGKKQKHPNPQGKGVNPRLDLLAEAAGAIRLPAVREESAARLVEDYLASLVVLSCEFKFRPVRGGRYSRLPLRGSQWSLCVAGYLEARI